MTNKDQPVPGWVLDLLDAFLGDGAWNTGDPEIPPQIFERIAQHNARDITGERIAEIKARDTASAEDVSWLIAEIERLRSQPQSSRSRQIAHTPGVASSSQRRNAQHASVAAVKGD